MHTKTPIIGKKVVFNAIPRLFFSNLNNTDQKITIKEFDVILKIQSHDFSGNKLFPKIEDLSKNSGYSKQSIWRFVSSLVKKELITTEHIRDEKWQFKTKLYNLENFYNKCISSLDSDNEKEISWKPKKIIPTLNWKFWKYREDILQKWFIRAPRWLDIYQKDLKIDAYESVFLKYVFWFIDEHWRTSVSLRWLSRNTSFTTDKLTTVIADLEKKGLIKITTRFKKNWFKTSNSYDLTGLIDQIIFLEGKKKISNHEAFMKSCNWTRVHKWSSLIKKSEYKTSEERILKEQRKEQRIDQIQDKIRFLYSDPSQISRNISEIKELQQELENINSNHTDQTNKGDSYLWVLMWNIIWNKQFIVNNRKIKKSKSSYTIEHFIEAEEICNQLNWNWKKDKWFFVKSIKLFPWTVYRHLTDAKEKAKKNKLKYFAKTMANEFKKIKN